MYTELLIITHSKVEQQNSSPINNLNTAGLSVFHKPLTWYNRNVCKSFRMFISDLLFLYPWYSLGFLFPTRSSCFVLLKLDALAGCSFQKRLHFYYLKAKCTVCLLMHGSTTELFGGQNASNLSVKKVYRQETDSLTS